MLFLYVFKKNRKNTNDFEKIAFRKNHYYIFCLKIGLHSSAYTQSLGIQKKIQILYIYIYIYICICICGYIYIYIYVCVFTFLFVNRFSKELKKQHFFANMIIPIDAAKFSQMFIGFHNKKHYIYIYIDIYIYIYIYIGISSPMSMGSPMGAPFKQSKKS